MQQKTNAAPPKQARSSQDETNAKENKQKITPIHRKPTTSRTINPPELGASPKKNV
jgi:hypothetical protein